MKCRYLLGMVASETADEFAKGGALLERVRGGGIGVKNTCGGNLQNVQNV